MPSKNTLVEIVNLPAPDPWDRVGVAAQVIVAIVAVYLAYRANRINKDSHFVGPMVGQLFDLRNRLREVRREYFALFEPFSTVKEKASQREKWLTLKESVGDELETLYEMFDEARPLEDRWRDVDECEDGHVFTASLALNAGKQAKAQFTRAYDDMVRTIVSCVRGARR